MNTCNTVWLYDRLPEHHSAFKHVPLYGGACLQAYSLKRLARGLASSRQGARQGFAAALAATLAHSAAAAAGEQSRTRLKQPCVAAAGALVLLEACLEVTGSMNGTVGSDFRLQEYNHRVLDAWKPPRN